MASKTKLVRRYLVMIVLLGTALVGSWIWFYWQIISTTSFSIPVDLPPTSHNETEQKAVVHISADEQFYVNEIECSREEVATLLDEYFSSAENEPSSKQIVQLHVDRDVSAQLLTEVLNLCRQRNWKVALATAHKN